MNMKLEQLKKRMGEDLGKLSCWRWLCKERKVVTEEDEIAIAEEVLAMPPMGNVAAAQTYWLRLQGKKTGNIRDLLAKSRISDDANEAGIHRIEVALAPAESG